MRTTIFFASPRPQQKRTAYKHEFIKFVPEKITATQLNMASRYVTHTTIQKVDLVLAAHVSQ